MTVGLATIDISPLFGRDGAARQAAAEAIGAAAERDGFFYAAGCGLAPDTVSRLDAAARDFFALPEARKAEIAMARGGLAWRGWFPLGGELTSGVPDQKEGLYFGEELGSDDPRVVARWPLHGANPWPVRPAELRGAVETYMTEASRAAAAIIQGVSLALGLAADHFARAYLARPTVLFRIFRYPPAATQGWGVGEHTDYGLLTLLAQDDQGGLQVRSDRGWVDVPPVAETLVVNVGDMLERLSGGRFVSAPHRVRNAGARDRLSFPLFYDPDFAAEMIPAARPIGRSARERWDRIDPNAFSGRYGDYLLRKVGAVFPELKTSSGF
jgi:isopenicillin N synthase-like dioxygenase